MGLWYNVRCNASVDSYVFRNMKMKLEIGTNLTCLILAVSVITAAAYTGKMGVLWLLLLLLLV